MKGTNHASKNLAEEQKMKDSNKDSHKDFEMEIAGAPGAPCAKLLSACWWFASRGL